MFGRPLSKPFTTYMNDVTPRKVPLEQFKLKYFQYCFRNMLTEESDDRQIRKFLIAERTNPITETYFGISTHALYTISGCVLDEIGLDALEGRSHGTAIHTLMNVVSVTPTLRIDNAKARKMNRKISKIIGTPVLSEMNCLGGCSIFSQYATRLFGRYRLYSSVWSCSLEAGENGDPITCVSHCPASYQPLLYLWCHTTEALTRCMPLAHDVSRRTRLCS
jgi:hypothetical protein